MRWVLANHLSSFLINFLTNCTYCFRRNIEYPILYTLYRFVKNFQISLSYSFVIQYAESVRVLTSFVCSVIFLLCLLHWCVLFSVVFISRYHIAYTVAYECLFIVDLVCNLRTSRTISLITRSFPSRHSPFIVIPVSFHLHTFLPHSADLRAIILKLARHRCETKPYVHRR